ncbi:MAG TPA: hypothetical protein VF506_02120 [Streptosporangiaceae bacterium]
MMLNLWPDQLVKTTHFDQEVRLLADRHYSRRTPGARQFCYSGRKLVLRNTEATVLWVWMYPDPAMRMDGQTGYNCAIFRNESNRRSSDIILEAEQHAITKWGPGRMYTYVDPAKVQSSNPGYCYLRADWHPHGYSKSGQRLLVKYDDCPA